MSIVNKMITNWAKPQNGRCIILTLCTIFSIEIAKTERREHINAKKVLNR